MQLTRQDEVSSAQVARAIQTDPVLVMRVLKLANACLGPGIRPVLAIRDAVGILGLNAVRSLALGFSLIGDKHLRGCRAFDYPAFWSRSLACAVGMHALAARSGLMQRDEAFTLGLLAHIGELGLASLFPDDYARLLEGAPHPGSECLAQERRFFDFDHADLSAALLADWGFPDRLVEPVTYHEQPETAHFAAGSRSEHLVLMLMLAAKIATVCMAVKDQRRAMIASLFLLGGKLSIGAEDLLSLCDGIVRDWSDWCQLLEVPAQSVPPFAELMNAPPAPSLDQTQGFPRIKAADTFHVLVVDDDQGMCILLKSLLTKAGYTCSVAENGRQGLELAYAERPDLMIVDWLMPEMDGIELIGALRQTASGRAIYILLLTSLDDEKRLVEAFAAGADDFLPKPLKSNVLTARLIAGQRVVSLQREIQRDLTNLQNFATEFASLNQQLQESNQASLLAQRRMELAVIGGDLGMWDLHLPSGVVLFSERTCAMLGDHPDETHLDVDRWRQRMHPDDRVVIHAALQAHLKGETPSYEGEYRIRHHDGHWVWLLDRGRVVERDADGAPFRVAGTHMNITERKQAEVELKRHREHLEELVEHRTLALAIAKEAAEAASRAKSIFLATMSHELRTPMNGIMGTFTLAARLATEPKQIDFLNKGMVSAKHLLSILSNILDLANIEADRLTLDEENFSLTQVIDDTLRMHDRAAQNKGLHLSCEIAAELPGILRGDASRLKQILLNFVDNAIKFSAQGQITVRAHQAEEGERGVLLRIEVSDQGIGISPAQQARLFQPFTQVDGSSTRKYGGSGLGLSLCKRLANLMGGEAGVISQEGYGSTFWISAWLKRGVDVQPPDPILHTESPR